MAEAVLPANSVGIWACAIGGGARSELWRRMQADIYGVPIYRTVVEEGRDYGAALPGAIAAGLFASVEEACSVVRLRPEVVEPDAECMRTYRDYYDAYTRLYPTNSGVMHRLSELAADADDPEIDGIARL